MSWLDTILEENKKFRERISIYALSPERQPCPHAVVVCMDPRVNLAAAGVSPFRPTGEIQSQVRVIRTLGGIADKRSLVVGIHLAGFKEIAIIMHTDCACSLLYQKIDTLIENMQANLTTEKWQKFKEFVGEPVREKLQNWLQAFQDPREAVRKEIKAIKGYPFVPENLIVHGLLYDLSSGRIEIVVNGYES